ncbi:MAG: hypothetical protein CVU81_00460 [Euryarchaeota archaeon HGW-Euryarchaeota-1]|nr:MAG: hypothetical protein CVU81_00460 [Euryarchaeota archaeon HGW-Euryarchaeota-1]
MTIKIQNVRIISKTKKAEYMLQNNIICRRIYMVLKQSFKTLFFWIKTRALKQSFKTFLSDGVR